jgi:glycosyltransferase involved in cell wall biosynthesis
MGTRSHSHTSSGGGPLVSVVMASYNHAPFLEAAVSSVLEQTLGDFELIIVDDGSTDGSQRLLQRFTDPRVTLVLQDNQGPSAAANAGLARARGQYVALMSSDDVCYPHRLQTQLDYLKGEGVDAVFALPRIIDSEGNIRDDADFPVFFHRTFASSADLFRQFFYQGNFLCAPSAMLRTEAVRAVGGFRLGSIQLQDWELWVRMCPRFKFALLGERLVQYRVRPGQNLSSGHRAVRTRFETSVIYRSFFDGVSADFLRKAFPQVMGPDVAASPEEVELDKSFVYLSHGDALVRSIGAERLFTQFEDDRLAARLREERGFDLRQFFQVTDALDFQNLGDLRALRAECSTLRRKLHSRP